jgi:amino acid transporter
MIEDGLTPWIDMPYEFQGPAEVPAYTAVGASVGLFANGGLGMLATSARPPSEPLRRAAWVVLIAGPLVAGVLVVLLQVAVRSTSPAGEPGSATTRNRISSEDG